MERAVGVHCRRLPRHDLAIAPYAGKGTGETTLLRKMYDSSRPAT